MKERRYDLNEIDSFILILLAKLPNSLEHNSLRWAEIRDFVWNYREDFEEFKTYYPLEKETVGMKVWNSLSKLGEYGFVKKEILAHKNVRYSIANKELKQEIAGLFDKFGGVGWMKEYYLEPLPASLCEEGDSFETFKEKFFKLEENWLQIIYLDMKMQRKGKPSIVRPAKKGKVVRPFENLSDEEYARVMRQGVQTRK